MRRTASSLPTNIAEGCGRSHPKDVRRFLDVAMGSASELEYQLLLARDLKMLDNNHYERLHDAVCETKRDADWFHEKIELVISCQLSLVMIAEN
jgi:four helix bundle protein